MVIKDRRKKILRDAIEDYLHQASLNPPAPLPKRIKRLLIGGGLLILAVLVWSQLTR
jgi:hypothetical protein